TLFVIFFVFITIFSTFYLFVYLLFFFFFFFLNDPAPPEISPLSLHAALPIGDSAPGAWAWSPDCSSTFSAGRTCPPIDRKSTRLNSSHANISYAVFCLTK